ncbi:MAG: pilus assembly protein [Alphaproteobacteria bacterium]|nr:pilus assembly protein [Alphaproteobacteria bacterium]
MLRRDRRGAAHLEFGLTLPLFVLLIVGSMEMAWLFFQRSALDSAASIGCRAGALVDPGYQDADFTDVESAAQSAMVTAFEENGGDCSSAACDTSVTAFGDVPGRSLQCSVSIEFQPLLGWVLSEFTLQSSQVVRMEWQR